MEAWKKLASVHMPSGPARRIQLFKQLLYTKMSESESITVHLSNLSDVLEKLQEIYQTVSDEMLVIILFYVICTKIS